MRLGAVDDDTLEAAPLVVGEAKEREIDYLRAVFLFVVPAVCNCSNHML